MTRSAITDAVLTEADGFYDIQFDDTGDILTADFFDTSLLMSIYCDQRALSSEMPQSERRRGWIGNKNGFEVGSKLWLFEQSRITRTTLNEIASVANNAVQWLVDDAYAVSTEATVSFSSGAVALEIQIKRPQSQVEKRFYQLWDNTGRA